MCVLKMYLRVKTANMRRANPVIVLSQTNGFQSELLEILE